MRFDDKELDFDVEEGRSGNSAIVILCPNLELTERAIGASRSFPAKGLPVTECCYDFARRCCRRVVTISCTSAAVFTSEQRGRAANSSFQSLERLSFTKPYRSGTSNPSRSLRIIVRKCLSLREIESYLDGSSRTCYYNRKTTHLWHQ